MPRLKRFTIGWLMVVIAWVGVGFWFWREGDRGGALSGANMLFPFYFVLTLAFAAGHVFDFWSSRK